MFRRKPVQGRAGHRGYDPSAVTSSRYYVKETILELCPEPGTDNWFFANFGVRLENMWGRDVTEININYDA